VALELPTATTVEPDEAGAGSSSAGQASAVEARWLEVVQLERELAALEAEIASRQAAICRRKAELWSEEHRIGGGAPIARVRPPRPPLRRLIKGVVGMRLQLEPYHAPRPLRVPDRYTRSPRLDSPPSISIVTPSFNQARFLPQTMSSVLDQGYAALEYVVQDGGSADGTGTVLERFRSRLHHAESRSDLGQAHAINLGFSRTSGELMAYLNSDDLLLPGSLDYVARYFAAHPKVDVVYGHRVLIDEQGREIGRWILPPHRDEHLYYADYVPQETLFWRRRIWQRAGGQVDQSFFFAIDWELLFRFIEAGARIVRLPRFLGAFRVHDAQKTTRQLAGIGAYEMDRLRHRHHGRGLSPEEVQRGLVRFMLAHAVCRRLYQCGLLRY
jgi:GT2 family glycosyltransferase